MKIFKYITIVVLIVFASACAESPWALFGGFAGDGQMNGGVRYLATDKICLDASLSASVGDNNSVGAFVDVFYKTWGVVIGLEKPAQSDVEIDLALAYALEKSITKDIALGISPSLVSKRMTENDNVEILSNWLVYAVICF